MDRRRRILLVGGEDHQLRIPYIHALQERGFYVAAAGSGKPDSFTATGVDYYPFVFDRFSPRGDWRAITRLASIFADARADVVHSFDSKPNFLAPLAASKNHIVVRTINGLGWVFSSSAPAALALRPVYMALQRCAASFTTATVFQNLEDLAFFNKWRLVDAATSHHIAGSGIDVQAFERALAAAPLSSLREKLSLGRSKVVITVTRVTKQKGIPSLLKAAKIVHELNPDVRFLLVGPRESEGPFAVTSADLEEHAPYVISLGNRSDVPALLRLADVCAFPTEYREGVPRVLLEAGLAGLPIVTTKMPGCTDLVKEGWNGYVTPTATPHILAERILHLLSNPRMAAEMGARSRTVIREQFSLRLVAERYSNLYTRIIDHARDG